MNKRVLQQLLAALMLSALVACSGGGSDTPVIPETPSTIGDPPTTTPPTTGNPPTDPPTEPPVEPPAEPPSDNVESAAAASRFLQRATFGPTPQTMAALQEQSYEEWLDEQMALPASSHLNDLDTLLDANGLQGILNNTDKGPRRIGRMQVWWDITINHEDQLRQRVAYALSQILVVSDLGTLLDSRVRGIAHYNDILANHAFGNYRDLLEEVTLNPVMGVFLSMRRNEKADLANNIQPDENYARELMQLFSIGLVNLNIDGTPQLDNSGEPIPSYGQDEVLTLARVFTGWNFGDADTFQANRITNDSEVIPMKAFDQFHDDDAKNLFGVPMAAGQTAEEDLQQALDIIFTHQNVGPFISYRLIQRLVTSNPSPQYVARVATVFNDNGEGERGDLGAVVKAILLDPDALSENPGANSGKLKEPLLKVTAMFRAFQATGEYGPLRYTDSMLFELGQKPLSAPSVFNFYLPSYSPPGALSSNGLVSPESQILTEPTSIATSNRLALFIASQSLSNNPNSGLHGTEFDFSDETPLASQPAALIDHLNDLLMAGTMSPSMRDVVLQHVQQTPNGNGGENRVREAIFLIVTSPEFAYQQ